ncbi:hypothetical protein MKS88_000391 [Plasmodium brasilianum]|uniref:Uncharacterized protein n=1 Tax=Plasmodium brasilianum TaxID=5824 RepID=A0ACB9YH87_PLABR|nr:hypothetical protein MKS88_000391 [Plasmodium brasilianum]
MENKINISLFNKITIFFFLCWICHFYIYKSTIKKSLEENCNDCRNCYERNYRLLAQYKKDYSSALCLKEEMPMNGFPKKKDTINEKNISEKKKQPNKFPLEFAGGLRQALKDKSCTFETKKYSHLEKKIFKELDYTDFLKNNKTISTKVYKKIISKKYGLRIVLPVLFFLFLLIIFILECAMGSLGKTSLLYVLGLNNKYLTSLSTEEPWTLIIELMKKLGGFFKHSTPSASGASRVCQLCETAKEVSDICILGQFFRILIYFLPFIILSITLISGIIFYHKKVKKYEKIKFSKR